MTVYAFKLDPIMDAIQERDAITPLSEIIAQVKLENKRSNKKSKKRSKAEKRMLMQSIHVFPAATIF